MTLTEADIRRLPKVTLHDHLDGGLRADTVADIAAEIGHPLPAPRAELADWFYAAADSGSLVRYLATFDHTVACMQRREDLVRVAREFVLDMAADGVVYAETRWAPEQHLQAGLTMSAAVEAVRDGLAAGVAEAAAAGQRIVVRQLLCAMRHDDRALDVAELAVRYRDDGVAGFDIAGAEAGFPPSRHAEAFRYLQEHNVHITVHAGEAFGLPSIWQAVHVGGAERLGHGVRIVDDIDTTGEAPLVGRLAAYVRDRRIPLELCPSSNLQTGICASIQQHPIKLLAEQNFRVTVNCDNRLMSRTTLSRELLLLCDAFGWGLPMLRRLAINAAKSSFLPYPERLSLINDVVKPGYVLP